MNAMKNKIKSQKGASITFALLLFLVCAIISSIVIVAATAVGGRASQMAELDQRYYSVNSAAELLRDVLEQHTVTVTTGIDIKYDVDLEDKQVSSTKTISSKPYEIDYDDSRNMPVGSLIIDAAVQLVKEELTNKKDASTDDEEKKVIEGKINALPVVASLSALDLTVSGTGITKPDALKVKLSPSDVQSGIMTVSVSNQDTSKGTYTLGLTFKADIVQNENDLTSYDALRPKTDSSGIIIPGVYIRTKTENKTTISTIRWKLIDMRTVVAAVTSSPTTAPGGGE